MFILKKNIAHIIQKERQKEYDKCNKIFNTRINEVQKKSEKRYERTVKDMEDAHRLKIQEKDREIKKLQHEIEKNYSIYMEIKKRETHLDTITYEIEDEIERMLIKVQESIQPVYRTRAKVEAIKRKSNKKDTKIESIFRAVK